MGVVVLLVIIAIPVIIVGILLATKFGQQLKGNIVLSLGNTYFGPG